MSRSTRPVNPRRGAPMFPFFWRSVSRLVGLAVASSPVLAQVRVENGVVIRADLKASIPASASPLPRPGSGTGLTRVDTPNPAVPTPAFVSAPASSASSPYKRCDTNNVCQTPLLVTQGGLDSTLKWDLNACSVYFPYSEIRVGKSSQPTLRWVLVKDPTDPAKYEFDKSYGIEAFGNEPKTGLFKGFREPSGTAFVYTNLNLKTATISFQPNVWRVDKGGKLVPCNVSDPFVVNEN